VRVAHAIFRVPSEWLVRSFLGFMQAQKSSHQQLCFCFIFRIGTQPQSFFPYDLYSIFLSFHPAWLLNYYISHGTLVPKSKSSRLGLATDRPSKRYGRAQPYDEEERRPLVFPESARRRVLVVFLQRPLHCITILPTPSFLLLHDSSPVPPPNGPSSGLG
jgi:hypothetical protein